MLSIFTLIEMCEFGTHFKKMLTDPTFKNMS